MHNKPLLMLPFIFSLFPFIQFSLIGLEAIDVFQVDDIASKLATVDGNGSLYELCRLRFGCNATSKQTNR